MKMIISFLLLFIPFIASSKVNIYKSDSSLIGIEKINESDYFTSTFYGGSSDDGASSPADCTIKFILKRNEKGFSGSLIPFQTELMGYSNSERGGVIIESDKLGVTVISKDSLSVCPDSISFSGDYLLVNEDKKEYTNDFNELIQLNYHNAISEFKSGKNSAAIKSLEPYMAKAVMINFYKPDIYNDYGYFLQQAGNNKDAIKYLGIVKDKSPNRVSVYLNIADAYWGNHEKDEAVLNYNKYTEMMLTAGKDKMIPARVKERTN